MQTNLYIDKGQLCGMGRKQRLFFPFKESTVLRMIMGPKRVLWLSVWAGEGWTVPPKACCKGAMFSGERWVIGRERKRPLSEEKESSRRLLLGLYLFF